MYNVSGKFIHGEFSKTGVSLCKTSWFTLSVTSRREISRRDVKMSPLCHVATWITTSRRHFKISLSRRDVRFHVATSDEQPSVTSRREIFTSRRQIIGSLSRRDVVPHVATSFGKTLCHVATWSLTSRRLLVLLSVTSRRGISRRDVG